MTPEDFKESNVVFGKEQKEYLSLPAFINNSKEGEAVICWKLSFWERIKLLFSKRIWMMICTFNKPIMPMYMSVNKNDMFVNNHI